MNNILLILSVAIYAPVLYFMYFLEYYTGMLIVLAAPIYVLATSYFDAKKEKQ